MQRGHLRLNNFLGSLCYLSDGFYFSRCHYQITFPKISSIKSFPYSKAFSNFCLIGKYKTISFSCLGSNTFVCLYASVCVCVCYLVLFSFIEFLLLLVWLTHRPQTCPFFNIPSRFCCQQPHSLGKLSPLWKTQLKKRFSILRRAGIAKEILKYLCYDSP